MFPKQLFYVSAVLISLVASYYLGGAVAKAQATEKSWTLPYLTLIHEKLNDVELKARPKGFIDSIDDEIAPGNVVVHNIRIDFIAWQQRLTSDFRVCNCGWAPEFGKHYILKQICPPKEKSK